jgi:catechol 2,3-dioxygenase-like lactoylglutathione lyase family enzyme
MLLAINHIQITVPVGEEPEAKKFYCNLLGLMEIEKPDILKPNGGFWMKLENFQIHVGTESNVDRNKTKSHVAYEVSNIEEWKNKFKKENIVVIESQPIPGCERFEIRDPFGNRIEFMAIKPNQS